MVEIDLKKIVWSVKVSEEDSFSFTSSMEKPLWLKRL